MEIPVYVEVETVTQDSKIRAVQTALETKNRNTLAWKATVSTPSTGSIAAPCLPPPSGSHCSECSSRHPSARSHSYDAQCHWSDISTPSAYGSMDKGSCSWHLLLDRMSVLGTTISREGGILHETGRRRFSSFLLQSDDPLRMHFSMATCHHISGLGK